MNTWEQERVASVDMLINIIRHLQATRLKGNALETLTFQMIEGEWGGVKLGDSFTCWVEETPATEMIVQGIETGQNAAKLAAAVFDKCFTLVEAEPWSKPGTQQ